MPFLFQDMTYDYSTQTMYAIGYDESVYTTLLLKVNLTTGETTIAGEIGESKYVALACSYEGQLYAIDVDYGDLWSIDKFTGAATDIGYTGERVSEDLQSMEFDHETNTLYWAGYNFWGTIDTSTGAAEGISKLGNYAQVVGLYIPFKKTNPNAPAEISDLQITPGANGELSAELSWTNPSLTFGGNKLTNLTKIEIYRNEQLVHEITNPTIGEKSNWQDTGIQQNGSVVYRITAINNEGTSSTTAQAIFIGRDVPAAPSQLSLIALDENRAKITWTTPQSGANGGWIDASALTYKITRLPDSIVVAETTTGNEYIDIFFLQKKGHPPLGRRMPHQCTKQNRGGGRLYRNADPPAACGRITRRCNRRHPCHPAGCQQRQRRTCYRNRRCRRLPGKRRCRLLSGRWTRTGDPACWKRKP